MSSMQDNPYASSYMPTAAALAAESERVAFIRRTYAHLAAAIMARLAAGDSFSRPDSINVEHFSNSRETPASITEAAAAFDIGPPPFGR